MKNKHLTDTWPEWKEEKIDQLGIDSEHLECIVDWNIGFIEESISNPTMPKIRIPKFGRIIPTVGRINQILKTSLNWYRKGNKSRESMTKVIKEAWPIRNRLINEQDGEYTARNWHQHYKESAGKPFIVYADNIYTTARMWLDKGVNYLSEMNQKYK